MGVVEVQHGRLSIVVSRDSDGDIDNLAVKYDGDVMMDESSVPSGDSIAAILIPLKEAIDKALSDTELNKFIKECYAQVEDPEP
jgi:hypothetical protein